MIVIEINANESVFDLVRKYPEIKDIMVEIGFENITKPGMLQSAGRFMTIKKGAVMKGIDVKKIKRVFYENGFILKEI
jgi:hypothetical protein